MTTDAGASVSVNASGPVRSLFDPGTGVFEFIARGNNIVWLTPEDVAATGLPEIFAASGPIHLVFGADGALLEVKRINHKVTDLCAALTQD